MVKKIVKQKEFILVKSLLEGGVSKVKISKILERSTATIHRIAQARNWDNYVEQKTLYAERLRGQKEQRNGNGNGGEKIKEVNMNKVQSELIKIKEAISKLEIWTSI